MIFHNISPNIKNIGTGVNMVQHKLPALYWYQKCICGSPGRTRSIGNESIRLQRVREHFSPRHKTSSKVNELLSEISLKKHTKTHIPQLNVYGKHCMEVLTSTYNKKGNFVLRNLLLIQVNNVTKSNGSCRSSFMAHCNSIIYHMQISQCVSKHK